MGAGCSCVIFTTYSIEDYYMPSSICQLLVLDSFDSISSRSTAERSFKVCWKNWMIIRFMWKRHLTPTKWWSEAASWSWTSFTLCHLRIIIIERTFPSTPIQRFTLMMNRIVTEKDKQPCWMNIAWSGDLCHSQFTHHRSDWDSSHRLHCL